MTRQIKKEWYKSKTVQAAAASLFIAVLAAMLGEAHPIVAVAVASASALGMYGRKVAQGPLK